MKINLSHRLIYVIVGVMAMGVMGIFGNPKLALAAESIPGTAGCKYDENPSKDFVNAAQQAVRERAKDPDSVKFGRVVKIGDKGGGCIEYNAKNSFGGYTGMKTDSLYPLSPSELILLGVDFSGWEQCIRITCNK
jgi:hypothetical protein